MEHIILGRTGLKVNKNGFGALPIQRIDFQSARRLLRRAYANGFNFFDTSRIYTDSEEKIGYALNDQRHMLLIATKTKASNREEFFRDLEESLTMLRTDYVDLYQFHNVSFCPRPGDGTGLYEAMLEAKQQGKIRFIGITTHRLAVAQEIIRSGLYDTLQYPFSYLADDREIQLVRDCKRANMGFIAMKALAGGLVSSPAAAYAFMMAFDHAVPIWGIQRESELEQFISFSDLQPRLSGDILKIIQRDKEQIQGNFCRGCGYCLPCPAGIEIPNAARMSLLLRRAPVQEYLSPAWQEKMKLITQCIGCRHCADHCPYQLDTPSLLKENYRDYLAFLEQSPLAYGAAR